MPPSRTELPANGILQIRFGFHGQTFRGFEDYDVRIDVFENLHGESSLLTLTKIPHGSHTRANVYQVYAETLSRPGRRAS